MNNFLKKNKKYLETSLYIVIILLVVVGIFQLFGIVKPEGLVGKAVQATFKDSSTLGGIAQNSETYFNLGGIRYLLKVKDLDSDSGKLMVNLKEYTEDCLNGIDDNENGLIDCADVYCSGKMGPQGHYCCQYDTGCPDIVDSNLELSCYSNLCLSYSVCDTNVDCEDGETCLLYGVDKLCIKDEGDYCEDGIDNDLDTKIDYDDEDCGISCVIENGVETCEICNNNGVDDDGDGDADCDDRRCKSHFFCMGKVEFCGDGMDNDDDDADGVFGSAGDLIDCFDDDCDGKSCGVMHVCQESQCVEITEICDNSIDDDGDGLFDCNDEDCFDNELCVGEAICNNGVDDDGDDLVDCEDDDCNFKQCGATQVCIGNSCTDACDEDDMGALCLEGQSCPTYITECIEPFCIIFGTDETLFCQNDEATCDDGVDNDDDDGDGVIGSAGDLVDCADPDCYGLAGCEVPVEICDNGEDDDGDDLVDCEDLDCAEDAFCIPSVAELCYNLVDDDLDASIDCADPDCADDATCVNYLDLTFYDNAFEKGLDPNLFHETDMSNYHVVRRSIDEHYTDQQLYTDLEDVKITNVPDDLKDAVWIHPPDADKVLPLTEDHLELVYKIEKLDFTKDAIVYVVMNDLNEYWEFMLDQNYINTGLSFSTTTGDYIVAAFPFPGTDNPLTEIQNHLKFYGAGGLENNYLVAVKFDDFDNFDAAKNNLCSVHETNPPDNPDVTPFYTLFCGGGSE
ncbi:hypothetical protein HOC35_00455 [Candidatus Woesearchaeota archaeon]|nr:hypothetical protein [Candidatus Woesearchaeota archaeon]